MNTYRRRILLDPGAQGGGGGTTPPAPQLNDFVKSLPADLQGEKSLHTITDVTTLAKGFVHAQKMIGQKRLAAPDGTWTEGQWNEFYESVGRPKTAGDYTPVKIEGLPEVKLDDPRWKKTSEALHKAGLTQRQVDAVMGLYGADTIEGQKIVAQKRDTDKLAAEASLREVWKDKYDTNRDAAKAVALKFGDAEFNSYIVDGGGNDPRLLRFLSNVASAMMEDKTRGGSAADGLMVTDATRAANEINRLKTDKDFQEAFRRRDHPGHAVAVQQWMNLHKIVNPNEKVRPS
jgi:hypothetical protein